MSRSSSLLLLLAYAALAACSPAPEESDRVPAAAADASGSGASREDRPDAPIATLDDLLPDEFSRLTDRWVGDLDGMAERRMIRTLVVSGGPQFFYYQARPRGMIAELLGLFQAELNVQLDRRLDQVEVVPMPISRDQLIPALLNGQADLVAADLTITEARSELVDFSVPLVSGVDEILVFAPGKGADVASIDDLSGRQVYVRRSSSYFEHVGVLNEELVARGLPPVEVIAADELLRSQDILEMVNAGIVAATVIDSYKANFWSEVLTDMVIRDDLVVHAGGRIAWAFRKDSPALAEAVNEFVRGHREGTLVGNVLINRYMQNLDWVRNATSSGAIDKLEDLLSLFEAAGEAHDFDPLMLAAQAFQESELEHDRVSPVGAIGIMQIKPSTAADPNVGIDDISTPEANITAGARYLRFLVDRYFSDPGIEPVQGWMFALAAYNAGPARIASLRRQAEREGHDPNVWVENVEMVAARRIGRETVRYVRNVFKYYVAYRLAYESFRLRQDATAP